MKVSPFIKIHFSVTEKYITEFIGILGRVHKRSILDFNVAIRVHVQYDHAKTAKIQNEYCYQFVDTQELIDMHV